MPPSICSTFRLNIRSLSSNRPGGGESLFIHCDYDFKIRADLSLQSDGAEVELSGVSGGKNVIVGAIYRPPDCHQRF